MKQGIILGTTLLLAVRAFSAGPDHLVLSEVAVQGGIQTAYTSSKYVEIYNPTASAITDLHNYYITNSTIYHTFPTATRDGQIPGWPVGASTYKFPASSAPILSGGIVIVAEDSGAFLEAYFGGSLAAFQALPGNPQLFELNDRNPGIPNMNSLSPQVYPYGFQFGNGGRYGNPALIYWDGASDLVKDVDIMMYAGVGVDLGTSLGLVNKTGLLAEGPDADLIPSTYAADAGSTDNLTARFLNDTPKKLPYQYARRSLIEVGETTTGGNGITGHDETLEEINFTWAGQGETTATATPGVTSLPLSSADLPPVIYNAIRIQPFPMAGETINFQANVTDDASVVSVTLQVDTGSGFTPVAMSNTGPNDLWTASITAPANGTTVKWYVTAVDSGSLISTSNDFQFFSREYPGYESFKVGSIVVSDGDLKLTEVHFDPVLQDNGYESEFIELHNTTSNPIDISGFVISSALDNHDSRLGIPEGTIISPNDFLIFAAHKPLFLLCYPGFNPANVFDMGWPRNDPGGLLNKADGISLVHPNQVGTNGQSSTPTDVFYYSGMIYGSGASQTGDTLELMDLSGPNHDQAAWGVSPIKGGSPGRPSTLDNPSNIKITNEGRTVQYPSSSTPIVINADISGTGISAINLHYTSAPGFEYTTVPMSIAAGTTYTATLGTFPSGTIIKYFIEVVNSSGQARTWPPYAAPIAFHVDDNPVTDADLVINEIMTRVTTGGTQFIEIYNRRDTPVDVSYFKIGGIQIGRLIYNSPDPRVLPEGTIIPAKSYWVFAGKKSVLMEQHPTLDPTSVFDALYIYSIMPIGNGYAYITHANDINYQQLTWQYPGSPFELIAYNNDTDGWPDINNDHSFELKHYTLDNSLGYNWRASTVIGGTPQAQNSVVTSSAATDWSLFY